MRKKCENGISDSTKPLIHYPTTLVVGVCQTLLHWGFESLPDHQTEAMDKRAINERRAALMSHVPTCEVCREWQAISIESVGRMPRPGRFDDLIRRHRGHLVEVGLVPSDGEVAMMRRVMEDPACLGC